MTEKEDYCEHCKGVCRELDPFWWLRIPEEDEEEQECRKEE